MTTSPTNSTYSSSQSPSASPTPSSPRPSLPPGVSPLKLPTSAVSSPIGSLRNRSVTQDSSAKPIQSALGALRITVEEDKAPEEMYPYVTVVQIYGNLYSLTLNVPVFEINDETKLKAVLEKYKKPFLNHLEKNLPPNFDMEINEQMKVSFVDKGYDIDIPRPKDSYRQELRDPEAQRLSQIISSGDAETIESELNPLSAPPKPQPAPASAGQSAPISANGVHGISRGRQVWTCAFNSVIQYLNADPYVSNYLRNEKSTDPVFLKLQGILHKYDKKESVSDDIVDLRDLMGFVLNRQLDANEIADRILDLIPEEHQLFVRQTCQYNEDNLPPIDLNPHNQTINDSGKFIRLEIPNNPDEANIETMIKNFFTPNLSQIVFKTDGVFYQYPVTETRELVSVPHALHIQIDRLNHDNGHKIHTPVQIPDEIEIDVAGRKNRYRLASFVSHNGNGFVNKDGKRDSGGHFVAGRIEGGKKYLIDDSRISEKQEDWDRNLSQAYLVCYVPDEE